MALVADRRVKGLTNISLLATNFSPAKLLVLGQPSSINIQLGIEERLTESRSLLGERILESADIDSFQPVLQATFPGWSPLSIAARLGRQLEVGSETFYFTRTFRVTTANQNGTVALTGEEGFGIALDEANAEASYLKDLGQAFRLTRVADATFVPGTDTESFAVAADGAYQLSDDLIGSTVELRIPYTNASILKVGELPMITYDAVLTYVMRDLQLMQVVIPSLSLSPADGDLDPGAAEAPLSFRVTNDGSTCTPVEFRWIAQARAC